MKRICFLTLLAALASGQQLATAGVIELEASNHLGMRWSCRTCDPRPLNGMAINWGDPEHNQGFEDRTFLVYDLSGFDDPEMIESATLNLGMQNQDPGGPVGIVDISTTWLGNDELPPEAFWWGDYLLSFPANERRRIYEVDVTDFIRDGLGERKTPFAFFRLSTETFDRYFFEVNFPVPTLTLTIPEPSSGILFFALAAAVAIVRRQAGSHRG